MVVKSIFCYRKSPDLQLGMPLPFIATSDHNERPFRKTHISSHESQSISVNASLHSRDPSMTASLYSIDEDMQLDMLKNIVNQDYSPSQRLHASLLASDHSDHSSGNTVSLSSNIDPRPLDAKPRAESEEHH